MDVLLAHQRAVEAHSKYIRSSFQTLDPRLLTTLEPQLAPQRLAPPPWLRVEPPFEPAGTVAALAAQGLIHADLDALLLGRPLHRHELDTARRAAAGQDVVCASEPSLAANEPGLAAVLNALLSDAAALGPRALIVCAPGHSLQAHADQLYRCARNHTAATGARFPLSFACLDHQAHVNGEMDLLLATPAALDRLLLGEAGPTVRERLQARLRRLLVPDLHAWRGRAGADVALLLRRLQAQCAQRLACIATCASWTPEAAADERQAAIAKAAATLLGRPITAAQVVPESFVELPAPAASALHEAVVAGVPAGGRPAELRGHPLAQWLQRQFTGRCAGNRLARGPARPWADVAHQLAADAQVDDGTAHQALRGLLQWINRVQDASPAGAACAPAFTLYQALRRPGPGPVHATLEQDGRRVATLQPAHATDDGRPLFPLAFSRADSASGGPGPGLYCVSRVGDRLLPRAFDAAGEGEDGYLLPGEHAWQPAAAAGFLPAAWLRRDRLEPHRGVQAGFPRRLSFDAQGRCGDTTALPWQGWFMPAPLLFDPVARTAFGFATAEADKLHAGPPPAPRPAVAPRGALVLSECDSDPADGPPSLEPVRPPRMDLLAPDGLHAQLRALALSALQLPWCAGPCPVTALVDDGRRELPLRDEVRAALRLDAATRASLHAVAHRALPALPPAPAHTLDTLADSLDLALNPWRTLHRAARADLERATQALQGGLLRRDGAAWGRHQRLRGQAERMLQLLRGEAAEGLDVLCLLAEQGFIPTHHHARQPLRLFVPTPDGQGDFLVAPRAGALRVFGPLQRLRHGGADHRVRRTLAAHTATALTRARLARPSGGWLTGERALDELCPLTGAPLADADWERLNDLLALGDGVAEPADTASLEEARAARGLRISTALALPDAAAAARDPRATLSADRQALLHLRHLRAAHIVQLARHWHGVSEPGFPLDLASGQWLADMPAAAPAFPHAADAASAARATHFAQAAPANAPAAWRRHPRRRVTPWISWPADALLLTPAQALGLDRDALVALARLLPRAAERHFNLHPGELDAVPLGEGDVPALLLHEAGEGGLDVLRVLLESPHDLPGVLAQAHRLARHQAPPALRAALLRLADATVQPPAVPQAPAAVDYEARYAALLSQLPPQATAARRLLTFLHDHGLRLPDAVRRSVQGLYVRPDFYFEPRCWVFCINPQAAGEEEAGREALLDRGDEVWTWDAGEEDLQACVARRPDLFRRER